MKTGRLTRAYRIVRVVLHVLAGAALAALLLRRESESRRQWLIHWWSRVLLRILNIRFSVRGVPPGMETGNAIVVANHISWLDIYLLNSVRPARFVSKSEVRQWPVIGWLAYKGGTFFINRAKRHDTARINHEMAEALGKGGCVAVFPEGTTSHGDVLLPFHASLFQPAIHSESKLWPVALRYHNVDGTPSRAASYVGDTSFGESLSLVLSQREIHAELVFAEPIHTHGKARRELAQLSRQAIAAALNLPLPDAGEAADVDARGAAAGGNALVTA